MRLVAIALCSLAGSGCSVMSAAASVGSAAVSVGSTAVSVTASAVGVAADATVGTVKMVGRAVTPADPAPPAAAAGPR